MGYSDHAAASASGHRLNTRSPCWLPQAEGHGGYNRPNPPSPVSTAARSSDSAESLTAAPREVAGFLASDPDSGLPQVTKGLRAFFQEKWKDARHGLEDATAQRWL